MQMEINNGKKLLILFVVGFITALILFISDYIYKTVVF